jgi:hypothetical protein
MGNSPAKQKFSSMEKINKNEGNDTRFHFWNVYDSTLTQGDRNVTVFEFLTSPDHNKKNFPKSSARSEKDAQQPISEGELTHATALAKTALRVCGIYFVLTIFSP